MAEEHRPTKHRKLSPTAKITTFVTKILLDDAHDRFKNGNFVCSPFSLEILLGMLAAGAEGKTLKQLLDFLGHETMDQLLSESPSSKLLEQIMISNLQDGGGEGPDITSANGIWVDKKLNPVQSCYKQVLKTVYKTKTRTLDFENKPNKSARKINSWANKKTGGLIPTIIGEADMKEVVIVLANALYFKGVWSIPFEERMTRMKDFHLIDGGTVSAPFMTSRKNIMFNFGIGKGFKILQLPYRSESPSKIFSMYIFLPDMEYGLQDILKVFDSDHALLHKKFDLHRRPFNQLWIPKFKLSCTFKPKDVMKQMGLTLPFNPKNRELSRIVEPGCPIGDTLYISDILQKSFIEVDERGTKAAAVSLMSGRGGSPSSFVADHPFMFMIREETSLSVLFMGVVLNPGAE